jgi:hypothetical protein
MDILKTVTDWPVIVQGALGSALFWAVLEIGQRLAKKAAARVTNDRWAANSFALTALEGKGEFGDFCRFMCLYAALHYVVKAAIVAVLSLAIGSVADVFASAGYLIAVYFLFRALAFVPHTTSWGPLDVRKKMFQQLMDESQKKAKAGNPANPPASPAK